MSQTATHGTNARYHVGGCRCGECRAAANAHHRDYRRRKAIRDAGNVNGAWVWVDASRTREHVQWLVSQGIGWQKVARLAGMSNGHVSALLYGRYERGDKPLQRIHRDTEAKILAVSADSSKYVEASRTWELIECMKAYGIPKYRIAKALGNSGKYPPLQLSRTRILRRHAERIGELHWSLWGREEFRARCRCPRPESLLTSDIGEAS